MSATYLKLHIETEGGCRMKTKLYGKKRWYMFQNVKFPFRCCNIPASIAHELCISPKTYSNSRLVAVSSYHEKRWLIWLSISNLCDKGAGITYPSRNLEFILLFREVRVAQFVLCSVVQTGVGPFVFMSYDGIHFFSKWCFYFPLPRLIHSLSII